MVNTGGFDPPNGGSIPSPATLRGLNGYYCISKSYLSRV
jgi:hypothetical protein